jgi:hypothetical protein
MTWTALRGEILLVTGALGSLGRTAVCAGIERGACHSGRPAQPEEARRVTRCRSDYCHHDDGEIDSMPTLDAIADTVGHDVIGKLIPKLKAGGVLGSALVILFL